MTVSKARNNPSDRPAVAGRNSVVLDTILWWLVAGTVALTPLVVSVSGRDEFRAPKEYLFRAGGLFIAAVLGIRFLYFAMNSMRELVSHRHATIATALVLAWTAVSTAMATNVALSAWSLLRVAIGATFFIGAMIAVRQRTVAAIYPLLFPGVINSAVSFLQAGEIWDPIYRGSAPGAITALVGTSNDIGSHLLAPAIAAFALAVASRQRRLLHAGVALFLFSGLLVARSATAIAAYVIAVVALGALLSLRRALSFAAIAVVCIALGVVTLAPLRARAEFVRTAIAERDYNLLFSYRLSAFAAATHMLRDHPLTGVGPGCFAWNYFDYKIGVENHYAILRKPGDHKLFMFGEAHSDHLQVMAVSGLPGYLLFLSVLVLLAWQSRGASSAVAPQQRWARLCALPLAAGIAVITLAQFPLELAGSLVSLLYAAAMCMTWSAREDS